MAKSIRSIRGWLLVCLLAPGSGCASLFPERIQASPQLFNAVPATVFVADGAGDFQMVSSTLRHVTQKDGYPIDVITDAWSHGKFRILADQLDYSHARTQGAALAALVQEYHAAHPDRPLYLLGHSAGAAVILAALESLPPCVVDRAVLLSPALSAEYDVRPALRGVKRGLYVFYSSRDILYLGVATRILGTSDRLWTVASGNVGFHPRVDDDADLQQKLFQRPWRPGDNELGNNGGHFGFYQPDFLRVNILPLLNP